MSKLPRHTFLALLGIATLASAQTSRQEARILKFLGGPPVTCDFVSGTDCRIQVTVYAPGKFPDTQPDECAAEITVGDVTVPQGSKSTHARPITITWYLAKKDSADTAQYKFDANDGIKLDLRGVDKRYHATRNDYHPSKVSTQGDEFSWQVVNKKFRGKGFFCKYSPIDLFEDCEIKYLANVDGPNGRCASVDPTLINMGP